MQPPRLFVLVAVAFSATALGPNAASAWDRYSRNGDDSNCRKCHGDFSAPYVSAGDGEDWGTNLHDLHRTGMLADSCQACHDAAFFPVVLGSSTGDDNFEPLGCLGCHGRADDHSEANPAWPLPGYGAGLRQVHTRAGIRTCGFCHADSKPENYAPVPENVLPPFYSIDAPGLASIPRDSCDAATESFAGAERGLDNDGDGLYDAEDPDCVVDCSDADSDGVSPDGGACGPIDCDDANAEVSPAALETCDGTDNDCDGEVDEDCSAVDPGDDAGPDGDLPADFYASTPGTGAAGGCAASPSGRAATWPLVGFLLGLCALGLRRRS